MKKIDIRKIYGDFSSEKLDLNVVSSKLKATALLTPAIAALAIGDAIAAPVCYDGSPIHINDTTFGLDLNGDGLIDFNLVNTGNSNFIHEVSSGGGTNQFLVSLGPVGTYYSAANIATGYSINTGIVSGTCGSANALSAPAPIHFNTCYDTLSAGVFGNFNGANGWGYVGVKFFDAAGNQFMGWIEIDIFQNGDELIMQNFSYEAVASDPVFAGEGCDDPLEGIPTMGEWGLITLTLLILSLGTVLLFRRKEDEDFATETTVGNPLKNVKKYLDKK